MMDVKGKIFVFLVTSFLVTWGLYIKSWSFIKRWQTDISNAGLKFFTVVLLIWITIGVVVAIDVKPLQEIAFLMGFVVSMSVYGMFFVFKKFNSGIDD